MKKFVTLFLFIMLVSVSYAAQNDPGHLQLQSMSTNSWTKLSGTNYNMDSVCAYQTDSTFREKDCQNIPGAWGDGAFDPTRNELSLHGGGHDDSYSNAIYTFSIPTLSWRMESAPSPNFCWNCKVNSDGTPASRHTYDAFDFIPLLDAYIVSAAGGAYGDGQTPTYDTHIHKVGTTGSSRWESTGKAFGAEEPNVIGADSGVRHADGHMFTSSTANGGDPQVWEFNPLTKSWSFHSYIPFSPEYPLTGVVVGDRYVIVDGGSVDWIDTKNPSVGWTSASVGAQGGGYPAAFAINDDEFLTFNGGNSVRLVNLETETSTELNPSGSADGAPTNGVNDKFGCGIHEGIGFCAYVSGYQNGVNLLRLPQWITDRFTYASPEPPSTDPRIVITSPPNGASIPAGSVEITFNIQNFDIGALGEAHMHFYLDGEDLGNPFMFFNRPDCDPDGDCVAKDAGAGLEHSHTVHWTSPNSIEFSGIGPGTHTVDFVLADSSHNEISGTETSITFTMQTPPQGEFTLEEIRRDLDFPVTIQFSNDGYLYYNELGNARTMRLSPGFSGDPEFVYSWPDVIQGGERGLLGLALHPDFDTNGYLYTFMTKSGGSEVWRITVGSDGTGSDPQLIIGGIPNANNHNGGILVVGTDNKLYISTGDVNSHANVGQDLSTLAGKILRINLDGSIPSDNPFVGTSGARGEIWSYGIRNTFGLAVDRHTGNIWASENGPSFNDEFNSVIKGGNYGWDNVQGFCDDDVKTETPFCEANVVIEPLAAYTPTIAPVGLEVASENSVYGENYYSNVFMTERNNGRVIRYLMGGENFDELAIETFSGMPVGALLDITENPIDGYMYVSNFQGLYRMELTGASCTPTQEVCNGRDDDCDDQVDEGGVCGPVCGNSLVESGEQCDDGNTNNGDGCSSTCQNEIAEPVCGNSILESGEQCDDGNTANGDGCSSTCQRETVVSCTEDANKDGNINIFDLIFLVSVFGTSDTSGDVNSDGTVNIFDLLAVTLRFGETCDPPTPAEDVLIEAENMNHDGVTESNGHSSGGVLIKASGDILTASSLFTGGDGIYDIVLSYYDETDGVSQLTFSVGGTQLGQWDLDETTGTGARDPESLFTRTFTDFEVRTGDEILITCNTGGSEFCGLDKVDLLSKTPITCGVAGITRSCYSGPEGTAGIGICREGVDTCQSNGQWTGCQGEVLPGTTEICADQIDNDCNGETDEGTNCCAPGATTACYSGTPGTAGTGLCQEGIQTCNSAGAWGPCTGDVTPVVEACQDTLDNDCDGQVDEGFLPGTCTTCASLSCGDFSDQNTCIDHGCQAFFSCEWEGGSCVSGFDEFTVLLKNPTTASANDGQVYFEGIVPFEPGTVYRNDLPSMALFDSQGQRVTAQFTEWMVNRWKKDGDTSNPSIRAAKVVITDDLPARSGTTEGAKAYTVGKSSTLSSPLSAVQQGNGDIIVTTTRQSDSTTFRYTFSNNRLSNVEVNGQQVISDVDSRLLDRFGTTHKLSVTGNRIEQPEMELIQTGTEQVTVKISADAEFCSSSSGGMIPGWVNYYDIHRDGTLSIESFMHNGAHKNWCNGETAILSGALIYEEEGIEISTTLSGATMKVNGISASSTTQEDYDTFKIEGSTQSGRFKYATIENSQHTLFITEEYGLDLLWPAEISLSGGTLWLGIHPDWAGNKNGASSTHSQYSVDDGQFTVPMKFKIRFFETGDLPPTTTLDALGELDRWPAVLMPTREAYLQTDSIGSWAGNGVFDDPIYSLTPLTSPWSGPTHWNVRGGDGLIRDRTFDSAYLGKGPISGIGVNIIGEEDRLNTRTAAGGLPYANVVHMLTSDADDYINAILAGYAGFHISADKYLMTADEAAATHLGHTYAGPSGRDEGDGTPAPGADGPVGGIYDSGGASHDWFIGLMYEAASTSIPSEPMRDAVISRAAVPFAWSLANGCRVGIWGVTTPDSVVHKPPRESFDSRLLDPAAECYTGEGNVGNPDYNFGRGNPSWYTFDQQLSEGSDDFGPTVRNIAWNHLAMATAAAMHPDEEQARELMTKNLRIMEFYELYMDAVQPFTGLNQLTSRLNSAFEIGFLLGADSLVISQLEPGTQEYNDATSYYFKTVDFVAKDRHLAYGGQPPGFSGTTHSGIDPLTFASRIRPDAEVANILYDYICEIPGSPYGDLGPIFMSRPDGCPNSQGWTYGGIRYVGAGAENFVTTYSP